MSFTVKIPDIVLTTLSAVLGKSYTAWWVNLLHENPTHLVIETTLVRPRIPPPLLTEPKPLTVPLASARDHREDQCGRCFWFVEFGRRLWDPTRPPRPIRNGAGNGFVVCFFVVEAPVLWLDYNRRRWASRLGFVETGNADVVLESSLYP